MVFQTKESVQFVTSSYASTVTIGFLSVVTPVFS